MVGIQKPFLKWVGGKSQILERVLDKVPNSIENYYEPFVGGGSVLLAVLSLQKQGVIKISGSVYASDINGILIDVYKHVQDEKELLLEEITRHMSIYKTIGELKGTRSPKTLEEAMSSKESYYYWIRKEFNQMKTTSIARSALFLILNKTCFRGMYREGPNGFNVPFGHYKRDPTIFTSDELTTVSELLRDVKFTQCGFMDAFAKVKAGDFIYIDSPYAPENSRSFVGYMNDGFGPDDHQTLFEATRCLQGAKFLMSNSNVKVVRKAFESYQCDEVPARRAINAKKPGSKTTELLIYN